jgi:hypothetical protein
MLAIVADLGLKIEIFEKLDWMTLRMVQRILFVVLELALAIGTEIVVG